MKNDLPISPNKKFKYSITFQSWDEESLEIGETDDKGFDVENEVESIGDILYSANTTYGIYYPVSFGIWESTEPVEDSKFYEKGIRTYYSLHISNEDGTPISEEENSFITFLLSDGRYEIDKFREFAIGGIVLGSIALGVGALIAYVYFKDKKIDSQSKEVEHNGRKYPTKGAWKKEHNLENKNEEHEVPQGERKLENGGDTSIQISKDDYFLVVRNWVYFTFNYPMGFVKDAFDNSHFESKFTSSYDRFGSMGALVNFWGNLSGDNRLVLSTWIKNNYVNIKSDESQLKSISADDYSRIITHWNMFCYNYPNNFVNEAFDDSKHLLNKWNEAYNVASSTGAVNKFFSELSGDNQKILTDWVFENYKGSKFKFGGSVDLKNKEKEDMFLYLDENNWTIQTFMEKYNKTEDESDKIIDSWALARGVREYAGGGDVNDIDMEGIEKSAKFYADETRWTVPPTVEKFEAEIKEYQDLKKQLDNKEITPSKIIGKGHKSQYARGLAYKWIKERILIAEKAIEILQSRYADGGEAEKEGKNGYIAFYKDKQMEVYADTSLQARNKASKLFKAKKDWEVTVVLSEIEGKQVVHDATFETGGEVQDWMEEALESLIEETGNETLDITMVSNQDNEFIASNENEEYRVFKTEHDAEIVAENEVRDMMEESPENFNKDFIINYVDGKNYFKQELDEMNNGYAEDIKSESDSTYANRLIAEMVENGIMSEDDAESDNAEELAEENIGEFVELMTQGQLDEGSDGFDYFTSNFGEEETMRIVIDNNLIDIFKASKDAVAEDGIAHFLSSYDGETVYLSNDVVAYRVN